MTTTLGLPTWAWLPIAVGTWLAAAAWRVHVGPELRARHLSTCRVYWQMRVVLDTAEEVTGLICWWVVWTAPVAYGVIGFDAAGEAVCLLAMLRRRHRHRPPAWTCGEGHRHYASVLRLADVCHEAWRHRDHDDDCDHGPSRRRHGAPARLRRWTKVAVNPAFAPS